MNKYASEAIGTFVMVFSGTGAMIMNDINEENVSHLMVALAFGISVWAMIVVFAKRSGAHINPAVTLAFSITNLFSKKENIPYIAAQILGALVASFILSLIFQDHNTLGATIPSGTWMESFIWEYFLTFLLMLTILLVGQHKSWYKFTAFSVGFVVFLEAYFVGPITGASMNPARSISPAIISGQTEFLWIYIFSTILGALSASLVWKFMTNLRSKKKMIA